MQTTSYLGMVCYALALSRQVGTYLLANFCNFKIEIRVGASQNDQCYDLEEHGNIDLFSSSCQFASIYLMHKTQTCFPICWNTAVCCLSFFNIICLQKFPENQFSNIFAYLRRGFVSLLSSGLVDFFSSLYPIVKVQIKGI